MEGQKSEISLNPPTGVDRGIRMQSNIVMNKSRWYRPAQDEEKAQAPRERAPLPEDELIPHTKSAS